MDPVTPELDYIVFSLDLNWKKLALGNSTSLVLDITLDPTLFLLVILPFGQKEYHSILTIQELQTVMIIL